MMVMALLGTSGCSPAFWMYIMLCVGLVLFAAIMAGLTMALMSLDAMNIAIIEASGTDNERKYASAIKPLIQNRQVMRCERVQMCVRAG